MDDNDTHEQDSAPMRELRDRVKQLTAENKELSAFKRGVVFKDAGLDPGKGIGKAVFKEYDGDLDAEAIRSYATDEYGWEQPSDDDAPAVTSEPTSREQAQERVKGVMSESGPVGASPNIEWPEYQSMLTTNPTEAVAARRAGLVKVPEHVAAAGR